MTDHAQPQDRLGPGRTRAEDLANLAAGHETGWWDDHGRPAPWPDDFFDEHNSWHPAGDNLTPEPDKPPADF